MKLLLHCIIGTACAVRFVTAAVNVFAPAQAGTVTAAGNSFNPTFSADGQHLVFVSHANNLVTNDNLNPWLDVFVRDLVASNTVLVSVSTNGFGGANWDANYPSVSSNGQFIAFASRASNLVPADTNDAIDVFVRDVVAGTTRLVNVDVNGNAPVDPVASSIIPLAGNPMISGDGRWVFFESRATNLIAANASPGSVNIYARDTWSNVTVLVTGDTNGYAAAGKCELTDITPDGRYALFIATNGGIAVYDYSGVRSLYLRDLAFATTELIHSNPDLPCARAVIATHGTNIVFSTESTVAPGSSNMVVRFVRSPVGGGARPLSIFATNTTLSMSADGTRVAFEAGGHAQLWIFDPDFEAYAQPISLLNASAHPLLSRDGQSVVFVEATTPAATQWQIYLQHLVTNYTLISTSSLGAASAGDFFFSAVAVSPNGSLVAFDSTANDLTSGDLNGASDIFLRDVNAGVTELITLAQPSRPAASAFTHSFLGLNSISADGRFVVALRYDDPSAYRDTNGWQDVFVSDVVNGTSVAVSINSNTYVTNFDGGAEPTVTFIENTNAYQSPIISADGSTVVAVGRRGFSYVTSARASNGVFSSSGMSVASRGTVASVSDSPTLSTDGLLLAFRSDANDLNPNVNDANGVSDVWVRYYFIGSNGLFFPTNYLISANYSGVASGNGPSLAPLFGPDSAWVLFATKAGNLLPASEGGTTSGPYGWYQVIANHLGTNRAATNYLLQVSNRLCTYSFSFQQYEWLDFSDTNLHHTNINAVLTPLLVDTTNAVFSGDSRFVVYALADASSIWRHDLLSIHTNLIPIRTFPIGVAIVTNSIVPGKSNDLVCVNCRNPSVNGDGNVVAYERVRSGSSVVDLFVRDFSASDETLVSGEMAGAPANGSSSSPLISGDGRYVVFQSQASDLVADDTNGANDIFVRDRLLGATMVVSANAQGRPGNGPSTRPVMAADGRTVVFQSFASDLVSGDYNDKRDLFVVKLGGADTDGDGMDDDWEMAYFNTLARNGSGDYDNDGATDLAEFRAATDPTNSNSIFRVLTVAPAGGGNTLVLWTGNPSLGYRAEFKDDLGAANWTALTGTISWNGATASIPDTTATNSAHRYYRVVRLP